jgi:hypothetical protein
MKRHHNGIISMTASEYEDMPDEDKGVIKSAVRYVHDNKRRPGRMGRQDGQDFDDHEYIGRRTLRIGARVVIEGFTLKIFGAVPSMGEFSLI